MLVKPEMLSFANNQTKNTLHLVCPSYYIQPLSAIILLICDMKVSPLVKHRAAERRKQNKWYFKVQLERKNSSFDFLSLFLKVKVLV